VFREEFQILRKIAKANECNANYNKMARRAPNARVKPAPTVRVVAPLDAVGEGKGLALAEPLRLIARAWKAEKFRGEFSTGLTAKTIPDPQWLP